MFVSVSWKLSHHCTDMQKMSGTGKKTQDLCTHSTFNNCCSFCCLFVSLFSFFKSLKIALLENFSRFFGIYLQTSKPEIFVLQGQMCVLLSILLKSVCTVCYCLQASDWPAWFGLYHHLLLWQVFFVHFFSFFFFNFLKQKIYFLLEVNLDLFLVSKHENHFNPPPPPL